MLGGAKSSKKAKFGPAACAWRGVGGAKSSEKASFGPAGCVSQVLRGAKSSEKARFGPAGCVAQVLHGAKSSKKASFGPAAESYRPAASGEKPPGHMRAPGVQYCQYDMLYKLSKHDFYVVFFCSFFNRNDVSGNFPAVYNHLLNALAYVIRVCNLDVVHCASVLTISA